MKSYLPPLIAAISAIALSSCSKLATSSDLKDYQAYDLPATLPSNPSAVRVKVSLRKQMIYVMEGSKPLLVTPCTVGAPGSATPQGNSTIILKNQYKRANSHGWAYNGKDARKAIIDVSRQRIFQPPQNTDLRKILAENYIASSPAPARICCCVF